MNLSDQQLKGGRKTWAIIVPAVGIAVVLCVLCVVWAGFDDSRRKESRQADTKQASLQAPVVDKQVDIRRSAEMGDAQAQVEIGEMYWRFYRAFQFP